MRKNLLASAAILSGLLYVGAASAQTMTSPALSAGAPQLAATNAAPAPGTVVIRIGGNFLFYAASTTDSANRSTPYVNGVANTTLAKKATYSFGDYFRLYPTVDGVAANGLRYGVYSEIREDNGAPGTGGGSLGSVSGTDKSNTLYVRRAYGYLGTANLGYLRLGTQDPAGGLFDTGSFQNFDVGGGWNGDINGLLSSNTTPTFPFLGGNSNFYTTNKLTYLSPQVYGLEFGVSYEPNTSNVTPTDSANASTGSLRLDSSSLASDLKRRRNTFNPAVRYRNTFGPIGIAADVSWMHSGHVSYDGVATSAIQNYQGLDFGNYGVVVTFGGLSVGGQVMEGAFNGNGNLKPQGTKNAFAYIVGASYTVGPLIVGASFYQLNMAGNSGSTPLLTQGSSTFAAVGQERDRGIAVGATYTLIPGVNLTASYLYGDKKENGWDFINNNQAYKGVSLTQGNAVHAQAIGTGVQFRW